MARTKSNDNENNSEDEVVLRSKTKSCVPMKCEPPDEGYNDSGSGQSLPIKKDDITSIGSDSFIGKKTENNQDEDVNRNQLKKLTNFQSLMEEEEEEDGSNGAIRILLDNSNDTVTVADDDDDDDDAIAADDSFEMIQDSREYSTRPISLPPLIKRGETFLRQSFSNFLLRRGFSRDSSKIFTSSSSTVSDDKSFPIEKVSDSERDEHTEVAKISADQELKYMVKLKENELPTLRFIRMNSTPISSSSLSLSSSATALNTNRLSFIMKTAGASKKSLLETFNTTKSKQLNEMRNDNNFCDLTLKCEDGFEIRVHKNVLSSASSYFQQLLTFPMKEKLEESISLPDIPGDVLEKIIAFIYTKKFEKIENVETIIEYAAFFQLEQLVEICSLALSKSLNDGTCVRYWQLARNNLIYDFENKCFAYVVSRAVHLFESSSMRDLTMEEMRSLLADNRLHLQCNEETIFEHVWKWAKGKDSETKSFSQVFSEVIDLLNFSKLENGFVFQKLFGNEDTLANTELLNKVAKLTKPKFKDEVVNRFIFLKPTRRRLLGLGHNKMFIGLGEESTIEKETNHLQLEFGYTTFDNKFLICGGKVDGAITNSCKFFEPSTQHWKKFPSMKEARQGHECSYLDNKIYACGGFYNETVEIFDLSKGEWNYGPEMTEENWDFGLTGVNGALYAISGGMGVQILDPRTQAWNLRSKCRAKHFGRVCCVSIGPCIYCFTSDKRFIFDTRSNKFSKVICCKQFSYDWSVCELEGYIYCLGYQKVSVDKYSLNLVQYHLDGSLGFEKSYELCEKPTKPAIVSLYY